MSKSLVVITGSTRGIGEATARAFANRGFGVVLVGRNEKDLKRVAESIGAAAIPVRADITDKKCDELILNAIGKHKLEGLINNAGIYRPEPFEKTAPDSWREHFDANFFSAVRLTRSLLPKLKAHGNGAIVNISSSAGFKAVAGMSAYSATKAAMNNWTQTLALELAPKIRVNAICPGIVDTPIHSFTRKQVEEMASMQPLGRIGRPEEVAEACVFLLESRWITGVLLPVDGGISLT